MTTAPDPTELDPCCPPLLAHALSEDEAGEISKLLKALADPARLRLVSLVASAPSGEVCACELTEPLGRSQATVSHHLSQLVKAGVLSRTQRGKWAWFRLRPERLASLRAALALPAEATHSRFGLTT